MKNHRITGQIRSVKELFKVLHLEKSIYFAPLNRVMPTKFFLGDSWRHGALQKHLKLSNFFRCQKKVLYFDKQQQRIHKVLREAVFSGGLNPGRPDLVYFN
jgi:hypothetical protein